MTTVANVADIEQAAAKPVSVVHLVLTLNIGGLEKFVYDLVRCTDQTRYSIRVLCLDEIGALGPQFENIGIPVETLGVHFRGVFQSIFRTARRLRELRPDVLHTHNPAAHIVGAPAARLSRVPAVVQTRHGSHRICGWKTIAGYRLASWLSDRIVPISTDSAEIAHAIDRDPPRKLEIIRNGIDLECDGRGARLCAASPRRAIHVARLSYPTKDQRTLLRAVRLVVDEVPDFTLDIVGDGPDRPALEALCDELHLRSNVNFLGYRHDIHERLQQAGLFMLSSMTEGISISLLEAMAAGLPIVATSVGGNPDVVVDGETGLLVPSQSPLAMAQATLELLRHPERATLMGLAGRRRVEQEFDIRVCAEKYERLYRRLLLG